MTKKPTAIVLVTGLALLALVLLPAALAAKGGSGGTPNKGGGGGNGGGGGIPGPTLVMVTDQNRNGVPNWDDTVTFTLPTTLPTDKPSVRVNCYQGSTWVYWASAGFWPGAPYEWARNFVLRSTYWTGGAADCVADLYYVTSRGKSVTLGTTPFHVEA